MEIVVRKLSELKQNEENIRMHPDTQIREYVRSLEKNGHLFSRQYQQLPRHTAHSCCEAQDVRNYPS